MKRGRRSRGETMQSPEGSFAGDGRLTDVDQDGEHHAGVAVVVNGAAQFDREAADLGLVTVDAELGDGVSEVVEPTGVRTGEGVGCAHASTVRTFSHSV